MRIASHPSSWEGVIFLGELVLEFISYFFLNFMYILYIIFRKLSSFLLLLDGGPGRLCSVVVRLKGVYSAIELQAHTGLSGESRPHGLVVPGHALC